MHHFQERERKRGPVIIVFSLVTCLIYTFMLEWDCKTAPSAKTWCRNFSTFFSAATKLLVLGNPFKLAQAKQEILPKSFQGNYWELKSGKKLQLGLDKN